MMTEEVVTRLEKSMAETQKDIEAGRLFRETAKEHRERITTLLERQIQRSLIEDPIFTKPLEELHSGCLRISSALNRLIEKRSGVNQV